MTDSKKNIVKTDELSIGYNSKSTKTVVGSHINITLKRGELVGLIGVNGSGKSTLIRTLSGLQERLSGSILLEGREIDTIPIDHLAETLSVVLTNQPISKNLSVIELVALGRQPYTNWLGKLLEKDKEIIRQSLKDTETYDLKDKKCYELSDGQLQRVLIARALAQDTDFIILDEPMTHLDLHHKASIFKLLSTIAHQKKKTVLFSTHDIEFALRLCDKMIVIGTRETCMDTPENLIKDGILDTLFPTHSITFDRDNRIFKLNE